MSKVKPVNLQSLGDALDTPFITPMSKRLIKAAWKGDLKNFVKYLFSFVWFGTRDYTMALIILTFIVAASKDDTVKEQLNNDVSTGNISRLFERIGRGDGKELRNFLNGEGKWFKELFEDLLKNHLEFKNDNDGEKKKKAINGLWTKFIKQVEKMTKWKRNENYVRENLCNAIARALGGHIADEVEKRLPPSPPPSVSTGSSKVLSSTSSLPDTKSDTNEKAIVQNAAVGGEVAKAVLEKTRQRQEIVEKNKKLAKQGEFTATALHDKTPILKLKGLEGVKNLPYATFHFYQDFSSFSDGECLLPFPRTDDINSYQIIKHVMELDKKNPGAFTRNSTDSKTKINTLVDDFFEGVSADRFDDMVTKVKGMNGIFICERLDKGGKDLTVYVKIQTGRNFAQEGTPGVDRYFERIVDFGSNVVFELLLKQLGLDSDDYVYIQTGLEDKLDKLTLYRAECNNEAFYLLTESKDVNDTKGYFKDLFLKGKLDNHKPFNMRFLAEWVVKNTYKDESYLKDLPGFLKNVIDVKIEENDYKSSDTEYWQNERKLSKEKLRKLNEEKIENDFKRKIRGGDRIFRIFKKVFPSEKFTEDVINSKLSELRSAVAKGDFANLLSELETVVPVFKTDIVWNTEFLSYIRPFVQGLKKDGNEYIIKFKKYAQEIYNKLDESVKAVFDFLVIVGILKDGNDTDFQQRYNIALGWKTEKLETPLNPGEKNEKLKAHIDDLITKFGRQPNLDNYKIPFLKEFLLNIIQYNNFSRGSDKQIRPIPSKIIDDLKPLPNDQYNYQNKQFEYGKEFIEVYDAINARIQSFMKPLEKKLTTVSSGEQGKGGDAKQN